MITRTDLDAAIAECQGQRYPNANTCIKLAAYFTIRNELYPDDQPGPSYAYAPDPDTPDDGYVKIDSDTEFAQLIDGRRQADVWPVLDELMTTVKAIYPRLYNAVLAKL